MTCCGWRTDPRRRAGWWLLLAGLALAPTGPLRAQAPLSHIPFCRADSGAVHFLAQVRYRLAAVDSATVARHHELGLGPAAPAPRLVSEDTVCINASAALARWAGAPATAPFPVAVVQAGPRYLVRADARADAAGAAVLVLDSGFGVLGEL